MYKWILTVIFGGVVASSLVYFAFFTSPCGRVCVAGHLVVAASEARQHIASGQGEENLAIHGAYVTYGVALRSGDVVVTNADHALVVIFQYPRSSGVEKWHCSIFPSEFAKLLKAEDCIIDP